MGRSLYGNVEADPCDAVLANAAQEAFGWMDQQRRCRVAGCSHKHAKYYFIHHNVEEIQGRHNVHVALCRRCMQEIASVATVRPDPDCD